MAFDLKIPSKPVTALINALSKHAGLEFEPRRIKNKAIAEAEAKVEVDRILKLGAIETNEMVHSALNRYLVKILKNQENIEAVIEDTRSLIVDNAKPEKLDKDWVNRFVDGAERVSDEKVRMLWAKILAGETNKPGSFNIRTLNVLANIGQQEADMIRSLASLTIEVDGLYWLLSPTNLQDLYAELGLSFDVFMELESLGVVNYSQDLIMQKECIIQQDLIRKSIGIVNSEEFFIEPNNRGDIGKPYKGMAEIGTIHLTDVGSQLISLVESPDRSKILEWASSADNYFGWKLVKEKI